MAHKQISPVKGWEYLFEVAMEAKVKSVDVRVCTQQWKMEVVFCCVLTA